MTLEVHVESAVTGGLAIIEHLPALRPCRLEGQNGIGKSALVRLLRLVSGEQPYPGDRGAWRSMKALLGPTTVTIQGFVGDFATARIVLSPERWPEEPVAEIGDWLGTVTFDGVSGEVSTLFAALTVIHLTGTEKLLDTLQHQYPRLAVVLGEMRRRLNELDDEHATLGELAEQLERLSPRRVEEERAATEEATRRRRAVGERLASVTPMVDDLTRAMALSALLRSGDAVERQEELQRLRQRLEEVRSELPRAEAAHDAAVAALGTGTAVQREAAKLERRLRTLSRKQDQLLSRQSALAARLEAIGAAPEAETLDEVQASHLTERLEQARERQRDEQLRAARRRRSEGENEVLDEVRVVLLDAKSRGLGSMVLAHLHGQDLTVDDLDTALGHIADLGEVTENDLIAANAEASEWSELESIFTEKAELRLSIDSVNRELAELGPQLADQDDLRQTATAARERLDAVANEIRATQVQIGALNQSGLGGGDIADAEAHVAELLDNHGVAADDLADVLADAQAELYDLQATDRALKQDLDDLANRTVRRRVQRESLRRRALGDPDLAWLAELATGQQPGELTAGDWDEETWQVVADHVTSVRHALTNLLRDVSGLEAVAGSKASTGPHAHAIDQLIERIAVDQLSAPPIAEALFGGGDVQRVSMEDKTITWTTADGERRTRPLSVFSSGEQALAFMRARLQQIADNPAQNRLIFLDEFGAFIAADRRRPLAELLTSEDLVGLSDQVVVILPLQADYQAELDQTSGDLREQYELRSAAIAERGYFTEAFDR